MIGAIFNVRKTLANFYINNTHMSYVNSIPNLLEDLQAKEIPMDRKPLTQMVWKINSIVSESSFV
jgi:hypothetical protein